MEATFPLPQPETSPEQSGQFRLEIPGYSQNLEASIDFAKSLANRFKAEFFTGFEYTMELEMVSGKRESGRGNAYLVLINVLRASPEQMAWLEDIGSRGFVPQAKAEIKQEEFGVPPSHHVRPEYVVGGKGQGFSISQANVRYIETAK